MPCCLDADGAIPLGNVFEQPLGEILTSARAVALKKSFETIKSAYESMGKNGNCHLVIGNGGHQFYPDDAWPIAKAML